jgi:hypothetical protein
MHLRSGGIVEVRRFGGAALPLASRSDIDLARQVTAPGATWLDYRLVERERMRLAMGGFGQEVRDAVKARAERLVSERLAHRRGSHIVPQPGLLATQRRREPRRHRRQAVGENRAALHSAGKRGENRRHLSLAPHADLWPVCRD